MFEFGKKLEKEIKANGSNRYLQRCLVSCDKAVDCMHEVNNFINRSLKDTDYRTCVRKFSERIKNMEMSEINSLDTKHGRLVLEGQMVFKKQTERHYNAKCYLMFFQRSIFAFEIENDSANQFKKFFTGVTSYDTSKDSYRYMCTIPVTKEMEVKGDKQVNANILTVSNLRSNSFLSNPHESFSLRIRDEKAFDELKLKVEKLVENASPRPNAEHQGCDFAPFIKHHEIDIAHPKPPPKCAECRHYLFGQLLCGYKCNTCRAIYHEKCFLDGESNSIYGNECVIKLKYLKT